MENLYEGMLPFSCIVQNYEEVKVFQLIIELYSKDVFNSPITRFVKIRESDYPLRLNIDINGIWTIGQQPAHYSYSLYSLDDIRVL